MPAAEQKVKAVKAMVHRIRNARRFIHRSLATTFIEVGNFRQAGAGFIQKFGDGAEVAQFDKAWYEAFVLPPEAGRVWKDGAETGENPPEQISWFHPTLARQALRVLISVTRRASVEETAQTNINGVVPHEIPEPPAALNSPRGKHIWRLMREKNFHTELELARAAHVDAATVSRFVRGQNTPSGRRPTKPRQRLLAALSIKNELEVPN